MGKIKVIEYIPIEMEKESKAWSLNNADVKRWLRNMAVFIMPVIGIYLASVSVNLQDGFNWSDFEIGLATQGAIALYVVNTLLDLFRKFQEGK